MAINMVRKPSETPNIKNLDDIIPFRYAYGNQNGYVIGRGNELSYSINGNQFKLNSGRVVVQGVESDIDANGVTIELDNVSGNRYFSIYYKVNMSTNVATIENTYDTAGYPTISDGDDLNVNTGGIANLLLYHFLVNNGSITNVEKIVKPIKYINENITAVNAQNVVSGGTIAGDVTGQTQSTDDNSNKIATTSFVHNVADSKMDKWVILYDNSGNTSKSITINNITQYQFIHLNGKKKIETNTHAISDFGEFTISALQAGIGVIDGYPGATIKLSDNTLTSAENKDASLSARNSYAMVTQVLGMKL